MTMLDFSFTSGLMAMLAGLASIASPCVLPVVPILVTGTEQDHRYRPVLMVLGLSLSFMTMGAVTSIFGGVVAGIMPAVEKIAGSFIILFGILMFLDVNLFKRLTIFNRIPGISQGGRWSGLILGLTLGLVWIPCVGPMLSGVLALVASKGSLLTGLLLLALYSLGFSIPMLLAAYASQSIRGKMRLFNQHPMAIRVLSGLLLIIFGLLLVSTGMMGMGNLF